MEFRLLFEGDLKPKQRAKAADIHAIRMQLHPQLKALWDFEPLNSRDRWLRPDPGNGDYGILESRNGQTYVPIVSARVHLFCELEVLFLRPQAPGQVLSDGGDIDNRLKTLFDALRVPSGSEQQAAGVQPPQSPDDPATWVYCLLQDDSLVVRLGLASDRLLRPPKAERETVVVITVRTRPSRSTMGNLSLT